MEVISHAVHELVYCTTSHWETECHGSRDYTCLGLIIVPGLAECLMHWHMDNAQWMTVE